MGTWVFEAVNFTTLRLPHGEMSSMSAMTDIVVVRRTKTRTLERPVFKESGRVLRHHHNEK